MRNFLITGVSKGLGLTIATLLLDANAENAVYGISRTTTKELSSLKDKYPNRLKTIEYDMSNTDDLRKTLFKEFVSNKIVLHGFVNNAAMAYDDIITNMNYEPLEHMFKVNVFAPMLCVKYVLRNMLLHKTKGSIIHVSSISVHTGYKGLSMYAATKGALEAFSKNTAREWGSIGIRSNALVAGFMETEMSATLSDDQKNRIFNRTSLKVPTTKASVAKMIIFLLSDGAASVTGQNIHVDSGTI